MPTPNVLADAFGPAISSRINGPVSAASVECESSCAKRCLYLIKGACSRLEFGNLIITGDTMTAHPAPGILNTIEGQRLSGVDAEHWRKWGPYLSERQWATVREDYSADGNAWSYFPHEHARSRAYRWGEDGLAGFSDVAQQWCLALGLWNERDPFIKERLFGLTNAEGNHGEDVKELYFYLDGVPSHSYMRMLYKYPHAEFPYADLVEENSRRGLEDAEYEILDTGVFNDNRYFDVTVEYAKNTPDDVLMRVTVVNRSTEAARLHVMPHLWTRNT